MLACGMCCVMGLAGYSSFLDLTDGEILENFHGLIVIPLNMLLLVHLVCYMPIDFIVMRYSVVKLWGYAVAGVGVGLGRGGRDRSDRGDRGDSAESGQFLCESSGSSSNNSSRAMNTPDIDADIDTDVELSIGWHVFTTLLLLYCKYLAHI